MDINFYTKFLVNFCNYSSTTIPDKKVQIFSNLHQLSFIFASSVHWRDDETHFTKHTHDKHMLFEVQLQWSFFPIEAAMEMDCTCSRPVIHFLAKWDSIQSIVIWSNLIATGETVDYSSSIILHISHTRMADSIKKLQKCMPQLEQAVWTHKESQHKSQIWFHTCFTPDLVMGKSLPLIDPRCNHQNFIISILLYLHSGGGLWLTPRVWIRKVITRSFQSSLPW